MSSAFVSMDLLHVDKKFNNVCHVFYKSIMNVVKELEAIMEKDEQDFCQIYVRQIVCLTNEHLLSPWKAKQKSILKKFWNIITDVCSLQLVFEKDHWK